MSKYGHWTVPRLKEELSRRDAVTTGRKIDLIERLEAYDRNHNFQAPVIHLPKPFSVGVDWPTCGYRQLTKEHRIIFSKLTKDQIDGYFLYRLAGDKQATGDIKALQKGEKLMKGGRVLACSVQVTNDIFLSGIVQAAMKKKVTYNIKMKVDKTSGSPVNSHCECPAGKGPSATCKHIAAVMLMLENFLRNGEIMIKKSCTEGLQTFHQPRTYYNGQPLKIESYFLNRKVDAYDDPRPVKYRKNPGYNDLVRNATFNFCSSTSADVGFKYIYNSKADIQAAQKDHDYLSLPFGEHWIDSALKITDAEAKTLEVKTIGQSENKKWFQARQWRITASRFGDICHSTSKRNLDKLCTSLSGNTDLRTPAIQHGKMYESKAIASFEGQMNLLTTKCGLFIHIDKPYIGASPDATVGEDAIVEVKCPYNGRNERVKPSDHFSFLTYDDNGNVTLKKTNKYYDQIQGQLYVTKRKLCYFVVYTFVDLFVEKIYIDRDYCEGCIIPKLDLFYTSHYRPYLASKLGITK